MPRLYEKPWAQVVRLSPAASSVIVAPHAHRKGRAAGRFSALSTRAAKPAAKTAKANGESDNGTKKNGKKRVHVVESGQTLSGIAQRYGSGVDAICEANGIDKKTPIRPGQELTIPD